MARLSFPTSCGVLLLIASRLTAATPSTKDRAPASTRPAPTTQPATTAFQVRLTGLSPIREAAVQFVAENNSFGDPHAPLVQGVAKIITDATERGNDFRIRLGDKLVKSGRVTQLTSEAGQLYIQEFTPAQALQLNQQERAVSQWTTVPLPTERLNQFPLEIGVPIFDGERPHSAKELSGTLDVRGLHRLEADVFTLRLTFCDPDVRSNRFLTAVRNPDDRQLRFKMKGPGPKLPAARSIIVLVDLCTLEMEGKQIKRVKVLSNTVAVVVDFTPDAE